MDYGAESLKRPVTVIINKSIITGVDPEDMKSARVRPSNFQEKQSLGYEQLSPSQHLKHCFKYFSKSCLLST